jgi:hypothetical protein
MEHSAGSMSLFSARTHMPLTAVAGGGGIRNLRIGSSVGMSLTLRSGAR